MFNFRNIDTVLLDMDGTLLDLHFDNQFWLHLVPQKYAEKHQMNLADAQAKMLTKYDKVKGTLDWYCLDYWTKELDLPIVELKYELSHLIQMRTDVPPFLKALKQANKHIVLLTNAHPDSLAVKLEQVPLADYLDLTISTHQFGYAKEAPQLWQAVEQQLKYDPSRCLFVDDNEPLLVVARTCGIGFQLGVANPDSKQQHKTFTEFDSITDFTTLIPAIEQSIS